MKSNVGVCVLIHILETIQRFFVLYVQSNFQTAFNVHLLNAQDVALVRPFIMASA